MNRDVARPSLRIVDAVETKEGAGATVKRLFPTTHEGPIDPFVMLDEFRIDPPSGFPDHPHRGFEIVTYMLEGGFRHRDDLGNDRTIGPGALQRITAGAGIVHSEQPAGPGSHGYQLWVNLPRALKGLPAAYQEVGPEEFPAKESDGVRVRVVVGEGSPVRLRTPVLVLDVTMDAGARFVREIPVGWNGFAYVERGRVEADGRRVGPGAAVVAEGGGTFACAAVVPSKFLLVAGFPIGERPRLLGPFVD